MKKLKEIKKFKIAVIYHSGDFDGVVSCALSKIFWDIAIETFNDYSSYNFDVEYIGYNYGTNINVDKWLNPFDGNDLKYDYIQFIDVTPPLSFFDDVRKYLLNKKLTIDIFDHHKVVYEEITKRYSDCISTKNLNYYYDSNYCATYIYYKLLLKNGWFKKLLFKIIDTKTKLLSNFIYYHPLSRINGNVREILNTNNVETIIFNIDSYDTWKWKLKSPINYEALKLNEYFLQYRSDDFKSVLVAENVLKGLIPNDEIFTIGNNIMEYKKSIANIQKTQIYEISFKNKDKIELVKFVLINDKANVYSIDAIQNKIDEAKFSQSHYGVESEFSNFIGIKLAIFYNNIDFKNNKINLSFRHINKKFNVCDFSKFICNGNAGGHFGASGGNLDLDKFVKLLEK